MTRKYLMEIVEGVGEHEFLTTYVIEATDRQKVKYHFHRTLKDHGYHDSHHQKHLLMGHQGLHAELESIVELDVKEWKHIHDKLPTWHKV